MPKIHRSLKRLSGLVNTTHLLQINWEICKKMSAELTAFSNNCGLEKMSRHSKWYWNIQFSGVYHHTKFERNWSANYHTKCKPMSKVCFCFVFSWKKKQPKLGFLPGCSVWTASSPHQISFNLLENCTRKWSQQVLLWADFVTPSQDQGHGNESGIKR